MYDAHTSNDTLWLRDGYLLSMRFLALIFAEKKNLSEVLASLPRFSVAETQLAVASGHAKASMIARLDGAKREPSLADEYEGIPLQMKNGTVTIVPGRGQLFRIIGEAENYEIASELCDEAIKILKNES